MFQYIIGEVTEIDIDFIILENHQIGYRLLASNNTISQVSLGNQFKLFTKLVVREDDLFLIGFFTMEEMRLYEFLTSVSKVGPRLANAILSAYDPETIISYILDRNVVALSSVSGVGKKTAERIILELSDKVVRTAGIQSLNGQQISKSSLDEAVEALLSLGFSKSECLSTAQQVLQLEPELSTDQLIKKALSLLSRL